MPIPTYRDVCLPFLRFAAAQSGGGDVRLADARQHLAEEFQLTKEEKERRGGQTDSLIFHSRVAWGRQELFWAGFIKSTGFGTFMITEGGRQFLSEAVNYTEEDNNSRFRKILSRAREEKRRRKEQQQASPTETLADEEGDDEDVGLSPDERIRLAYGELKSSLQSDLKDQIFSDKMDYTKFEILVLRFLEKIGYGEGGHTGGTGDGGIDGIMSADHLGLHRVFVQIKHYDSSNTISAAAIREFAGSLGQNSTAAQGIFVTSSTFTKGARNAAKDSPYHIVLINGDRLTELMVEHEIGIRVKETYSIYDIDKNFWTFDED